MAERERRRHLKAQTAVSHAARAIIDAAFEDGRGSYESIAADVLAQTGERIGKSSVARYWRVWNVSRRAKEAHEVAREKLEELRERPTAELEALLENIVATTIYEGLAEAQGTSVEPGELIRAKDRRDHLQLARQKLGLDQERKTLQDERLALDRERLQMERERAAAIDRPGLFLEFWKTVIETIAGSSPEGAAVLNQHFDQVMARIKAGS